VSTTPLPMATAPAEALDRAPLVRRARWLARIGLLWHGLEAAVALAAGLTAGSIALVGFGADSLAEALAGVVVLWRFAPARQEREEFERRAQRLVAVCFWLIAAYVGADAVSSLFTGARPQPSTVGIVLASVTLLLMPPLARAKARVAADLGSSAAASEGRQNLLCAYLSGALLVGLLGNAAAGLWWLDPAVALLVTGVAVKEGRDAWRGESCGCCSGPADCS